MSVRASSSAADASPSLMANVLRRSREQYERALSVEIGVGSA
jgi:lambda repressor-like predicted transcriptional regulator